MVMEEVPLVLRRGSDHDFEMDETDHLLPHSDDRMTDGMRTRSRIGWCTRLLTTCSRWCLCWCRCGGSELRNRNINLGCETRATGRFPPNVIRNQKYNFFTFLPKVLFEQFKFFLNLYFLVMAMTQFFPDIRIGYLYTYWGPLGFVLTVTMFREAVDDLRRHRRDKQVNSQLYKRLELNGEWSKTPASQLHVGDIIWVEKNERVPADLVLLRTTEASGTVFIRTDQLDGETDWKLRTAVHETQRLQNDADLLHIHATLFVEKPQRDIHTFIGTYTGETKMSLDIENTIWGNTVIANGAAIGVIVYTGSETRSVINNSQPRSKQGLFDMEINNLTKVLFGAVIGLALVMMGLKGFNGPWYWYLFRFILLFSYIIPLSLRVNLDMSKSFYSYCIQQDPDMPGTTVRSTTIPEELGRISYLLTDKTGTLTQNQMIFKKLHLERMSFGTDSFADVKSLLASAYAGKQESPSYDSEPSSSRSVSRKSDLVQVRTAVEAMALCHNVTPCYDAGFSHAEVSDTESEICYSADTQMSYQASSPDEIALVEWAEQMGVTLVRREVSLIHLRTSHPDSSQQLLTFTILQMFSFTPETKRMGIIVRNDATGEITFYLKGADVVMNNIVQYNDWLPEKCDNLAREGLRTLVVAKKSLTADQYSEFEAKYNSAKLNTTDRTSLVRAAIESLEREMELVCLTGVEDRLQDGVPATLEQLRDAGIKVWMLTGDKLETAQCIAKSSCLVARNQPMHVFKTVTTRTEAHNELNAFRRKLDTCLVITGDSLQICLQYYEDELMELACRAPAVVCCRCSPTQKAQVVKLIQQHTNKRTAAVGDGGNDVSMIQTSDAGVGIAGREGLQASLAADFSICQFSHLGRLLLVHGRNSYKRSAALSQFIIHRGLIISAMQAIFSAVFYFSSVALYQGFLVIGYATVYTMFPVFSLVLDQDVTTEVALRFPEIYKDLSKGRSMSYKTFFGWVLISIYQGGIIMYGALVLFKDDFIHIVGISFSALVLTELLMVALTIQTWHRYMVLAELLSLAIYILSLLVFKDFFDEEFIKTFNFLWMVVVITLLSCLPLYILKLLRKKFSPPSYSKLS